MMQYKPETKNEANLRDVRAEEEIKHVRHQGSLQQGRTEQVADTRTATQHILTQAATTDMNNFATNERIKSAKVAELEKKRAKLEKDEEKYRGFVNVAWMAFPVTIAVYVLTCCNVCLPELMKERKRNAKQKMDDVDAQLLALTNVNVNRNFAISDAVSSTNEDRRFTGTGDPQMESVYAARPPVATITTTTTGPAPPPNYHEYMGGATQIDIQ